MTIKSKIKKASFHNPAAAMRRHNMRKRLTNTNASFLCPSCIGGTMFHDLGLQFRSPTINLMFFQPDFVKFITHYNEYMAKSFEFYDDPEYSCPCAHLGDITIHFSHYKTPEQAVEAWNRRAKRVDWSNAFVWCSERDGITREEIESLAALDVRGIAVFTAHDYSDIPYALQLPGFEHLGRITNIQDIHYPTEIKNYEGYFDWVKWFNEANGAPYDVKTYSLIDKGIWKKWKLVEE